jgi:hypothetical protein
MGNAGQRKNKFPAHLFLEREGIGGSSSREADLVAATIVGAGGAPVEFPGRQPSKLRRRVLYSIRLSLNSFSQL